MGKILLTGSTGRLGQHVLPKLLERGEKIVAVVRPTSKRAEGLKGVEILRWDLAESPIPKSKLNGVSLAIHLSGLVGDRPLPELMANNALATKNLIASFAKGSLKKIVLASSVSVYGEHKGKLVDETFPCNPAGNYGYSKLMAERYAMEAKSESTTAIFLRFGMIYGPGFEEGYFQVLRLIEKGRMPIIGSGKNRMPLLHAQDAARAVLLAMDSRLKESGHFNIVGEEKPTQGELLEEAALQLGSKKPSFKIPIWLALAAASLFAKPLSLSAENIRQLSMDRAYSTRLSQEKLGFKAKIKLKEGVKEMVQIYKSKSNGSKM